MGNQCTTGCVKPSRKRPMHQELPNDIESYKSQNMNYSLPKITYEGEIFNIQMIDCPYGSYSLNFHISDVISISLPEKQMTRSNKLKSAHSDNNNQKIIKWKIREKFGFFLTEYEVRTRFLVIQVLGEKKVKINELRINLYMIATGPQHHDLEVKLPDKNYARLKFDFKISEIVQVHMDINKINIKFDKNYNGENIDYSFKITANNDVVAFAESFDPKTISVDETKQKYRQFQPQDEEKSPLRVRRTGTRGSRVIQNELNSFVQWGQYEQKNQHSKPLMTIVTKLLSNQINKSFMYFLLWKVEVSKQDQKQNQKCNLFGGSIVNFNKIFDKEHQDKTLLIQQQDQTTEQSTVKKVCFNIEKRNIKLEQLIWDEGGVPVGKCYIQFTISNSKFEKQLQACARTEDGIINMTFLSKGYKGSNNHATNQNMEKIIEKYESIQNLTKQLQKLSSDAYKNRSQIMSIQDNIEDTFKEIAQQIKNTLNQSYVIVAISNTKKVENLIEDQLLMINFLNRLYYYISDDTVYSSICWEISLYIFKRGQFYLQNIGFKGYTNQQDKIYQKKINVALKYQNILFKYFVQALKNSTITFKGSISPHIESFKAYCYIKIPVFRQKILDSINKTYDQEIVQFKLQQVQQATSQFSSLLKSQKDKFLINLDWEKYFYDHIKQSDENIQIQKELEEEIQHCPWIQDLSKRQETFFDFTAQLVRKMLEISNRIKVSRWNYFPGYTKIIRSFMVQMKKRSILEYPSLMVKTSSQLLANQQLINFLMPLVIQKTNVYCKLQVMKCINILENFFHSLTENRTRILPRNFNYLYFFKTLKLIFQKVDNIQSIVKFLIFLYDFYESFSPEWRDNITMFLLGKVFFKLFFHWSYQVRIIFYNFLIIKIYYIRIQKMPKLSSNSESVQMNTKIAQRYECINTILLNAQNQKHQQTLDFRMVYEKDLYKKMKNKIRKKQLKNKNKNKKISVTTDSRSLQKQGSTYQINNQAVSSNYSLEYLKESKTSIRKRSFPDQQLRNRSSTQFQFKHFQDKTHTQSCLKIVKGNSFCLDMAAVESVVGKSEEGTGSSKLLNTSQINPHDQQSSLEQILETKIHRRYTKDERMKPRISVQIGKKLNYNVYNKQDHQLSEISRSQLNYILKAVEQYKEALDDINEFHQKNGQLPKRQLNLDQFLLDKE